MGRTLKDPKDSKDTGASLSLLSLMSLMSLMPLNDRDLAQDAHGHRQGDQHQPAGGPERPARPGGSEDEGAGRRAEGPGEGSERAGEADRAALAPLVGEAAQEPEARRVVDSLPDGEQAQADQQEPELGPRRRDGCWSQWQQDEPGGHDDDAGENQGALAEALDQPSEQPPLYHHQHDADEHEQIGRASCR